MGLRSINPRYMARYYNSMHDTWLPVRADDYNPAQHGKDLRCGDTLCEAPVTHRHYQTQTSHGGSYFRRDHFVSLDRSAHREGCSWLAPDYDHHNSVSVREALDEELPVIINVNFWVGSALYNTFRDAVDREDMTTPYNRYRNENLHASISVRTLDEFFKAVERLKSHSAETAERAQVAHTQDIKPLSHVVLRAKGDEEKFIQLFRWMEYFNDNSMRPVSHSDFMRVIEFVPTKNEFKNAAKSTNEVRGTPVTLTRNHKASLVLLNTLELPNSAMRQEVLKYSAHELIAVPHIVMREVRSAKQDFNAGKDGFIPIRWFIRSSEQIRVAPHAQRVYDPELDRPRLLFDAS